MEAYTHACMGDVGGVGRWVGGLVMHTWVMHGWGGRVRKLGHMNVHSI